MGLLGCQVAVSSARHRPGAVLDTDPMDIYMAGCVPEYVAVFRVNLLGGFKGKPQGYRLRLFGWSRNSTYIYIYIYYIYTLVEGTHGFGPASPELKL